MTNEHLIWTTAYLCTGYLLFELACWTNRNSEKEKRILIGTSHFLIMVLLWPTVLVATLIKVIEKRSKK